MRKVYSLSQLTELETLEMFVCAREVVRVFDDLYNVKNFMILIDEKQENNATFCIQVLPREDNLTSSNSAENAHRIGEQFRQAAKNVRSLQEMESEALQYRHLFSQGVLAKQ